MMDWKLGLLLALNIGLFILLLGYLHVEVQLINRYNALMKSCPCWCIPNNMTLETPSELMNCTDHWTPEQFPINMKWLMNFSNGGC